MFSKSEKINSLESKINSNEDLDVCIEFLSSNEVASCALHFVSNDLAEDKLILLRDCLQKQTKLIKLSLTADLSFDLSLEKADQIASILGSAFSSLISLEFLTLRGLYADNTSAFLAELLKNSSILSVLSVGAYYRRQKGCVMREKGGLLIAEALTTNKSLTVLDLHSNAMGFNSALLIAQALISHTNLQRLDLSYNNISAEDKENVAILDLLKCNQGLTEIKLTDIHISPEKFAMIIFDFKQMLYFLEQSKKLTHLSLILRVEILEEQRKQLILILNQLKNLRVMEFFDFDDIDFISLSNEVFKRHPSIEQLTYRLDNNTAVFSVPVLIELIKNNSKLTALSIGPGNLRSSIPLLFVSEIFNALGENNNLVHFDFSNNYIKDVSSSSDIVAMLKKNRCLQSLNLANVFKQSDESIEIILAALAENQMLWNLDLRFNGSRIAFNCLTYLERNRNLTRLKLLNYPSVIYPEELSSGWSPDLMFYKHNSDIENKIHYQFYDSIQRILQRNLNLKTRLLYEKYLLLNLLGTIGFDFPLDMMKTIFYFLLAQYNQQELEDLRTTFKEKSSLQIEEIPDEYVEQFKTIYKALYEGQSSFFKYWNDLVDKKDLTKTEIENYISENPDSRSDQAWKLAKKYKIGCNNAVLVKEIHQYSYAHSSSFFGLFKRSENFPSGYENLKPQISAAREGSRTRTIIDVLESHSL